MSSSACSDVALFVIGAVLAVPAYRRLTPRGTLHAARGLPAAVACRGVLTFAFFATDAYVPLMLTDVRGLRAGIAGLALTAATLTWTTGAWVQERLVNRVGPRSLVRVGFLIILVGSAVFAVAVSSRVPAAVGIFGWGVAGLGMGLAYAPLSLIVLGEATVGQEGAAASALQLSDVLGIALGTGVAGALIAFGEDVSWLPRSALLLVYGMSIVVALGGAVVGHPLAGVGARHRPGVGYHFLSATAGSAPCSRRWVTSVVGSARVARRG